MDYTIPDRTQITLSEEDKKELRIAWEELRPRLRSFTEFAREMIFLGIDAVRRNKTAMDGAERLESSAYHAPGAGTSSEDLVKILQKLNRLEEKVDSIQSPKPLRNEKGTSLSSTPESHSKAKKDQKDV